MASDQYVRIGSVLGAFGIRGEVRLASFADPPESIADYGELQTEDGRRRLQIESLRPLRNGLAARFRDIESRNEAEALKGLGLYIPREILPELSGNEFYYADLVGLEVRLHGRVIGRVTAVQDFGAGALLEVAPEDGAASEFVTFTCENVPVVDTKHLEVTFDPFQSDGSADKQ